MATNRYIGARYVPIFAGAWDNTEEYEPLTIVTYQGDSYTSRGYVPTGVAIDNTQYWAKTGDFNQQVANMQQQLDYLQEQLSTIVSDTIDDINWTEIPLNQEQNTFVKGTGCYIKYKAIGRWVILAINLDVDNAFTGHVDLCDFPSAIMPDTPGFFGKYVVGFSGGETAILTATKDSPSATSMQLTITNPHDTGISSGFFSTQIFYLTE